MIRYPPKYLWECNQGWYQLIEEMIHELNIVFEEDDITIVQIKEKFGMLCVYPDRLLTEEYYNLVKKYEKKSLQTCELCGEEGKKVNDIGYIQVLCKTHHKEAFRHQQKYWDFIDWWRYYTHKIKHFIGLI